MLPFFKRFKTALRHENERPRWEEDFVDKFNEVYSHVSPEGGILTVLTNKTGAASVKGSVITVDSVDNAFDLEPNTSQFTAMGIVYDNGIPDGGQCRIVVAGVAEVLLENSTTAAPGNFVIASSTTSGRANASGSAVGSGTPTQEHFKEIGHCLETKAGGTDVLCKIITHFN